MDPQQKFCLKWNQFHQNFRTSFQDLRERQVLTDATLVCEDGSQIAVHRIVLAACSPFFLSIFQANSAPLHPWVFLKGISSAELALVTDYMYHGEVEVPQRQLLDFLAAAEDLKIKGLTGYKKNAQNLAGSVGPEKASGSGESVPGEQWTGDSKEAREAWEQQQQLVIGSAWSCQANLPDNQDTQVKLENNHDEEKEDNTANMEDADEKSLVIAEDEPNIVLKEKVIEVNAELDKQIEDNLVKSDGMWMCKVCGKCANHKSKLKQHVETHINGFSHPCSLCGKSYRSRNVLRMHMSRDHKNKHQQPNHLNKVQF